MIQYKYCLILLLLFIIFHLLLVSAEYVGKSNGQYFDLNLESVNSVYHRAAIMALMKARAKVLLKEPRMTLSDKVIYQHCARDSKNSVQLARCVVPLLALKDSPVQAQLQQDLSPLEKFVDFFKRAKNYLVQSDFLPNPLNKIVPVNSINIAISPNRATESIPSRPWRQPVPVKEFYSSNEAGNPKGLYKRHPIQVQDLKNRYYENGYENRRYYNVKSRKKREVERRNEFKNLSNLEKIERYYQMQQRVERFIKSVNDENSKFIDSTSQVPLKFALRKNKNMTVVENVFTAVNAMMGKGDGEFSFVSPRLLSILPSSEKGRKHLLSPTMFSFHEKDGFLPLPKILKSFNLEGDAKNSWMEMLLDISGASKALQDIVTQMEPDMIAMNEKVYPAIKDLEQIEENWKYVRSSYSKDQKADIDEYGYAFLEPEQIQLLYNNQYGHNLRLDLNEYSQLDKTERQRRIDEDIRKLAKLDEKKITRRVARMKRRRKRQVVHENGEITTNQSGTHHDYSQEEGGHEPHGPIHFITMEPWAFGSRIGQGVALEAVTLSPYAFFTELMMPEALVLQVLGPRAFVPAILSPSALMARILSPAAFRAEVLSPRALQAWILTPEAFIAEVLSPKMLEVRVLSPEAMVIQVLSPSIIAPRILSPEAGALVILSPSILSPRILSGHSLTVEVLSPHILGGGHSSHEDEEQGKEHHHMEDEHKDIHDILGGGHGSQGHGQTGHSHGQETAHQPHDGQHAAGENHVEGFVPQTAPQNPWQDTGQHQFGQANIQEQPLELGTGQVREIDLGQIQVEQNRINPERTGFRLF